MASKDDLVEETTKKAEKGNLTKKKVDKNVVEEPVQTLTAFGRHGVQSETPLDMAPPAYVDNKRPTGKTPRALDKPPSRLRVHLAAESVDFEALRATIGVALAVVQLPCNK